MGIKARSALIIVGLAAGLAFDAQAALAVPPIQPAIRAFTPRFSIDAPGNITFASNTLMTCNPSGLNGAACPGARADTSLGAVTSGALNNNNYNIVNVDVDSDPTTANSSTAQLTMPAGASVAWAGLYWTANSPSGLTAVAAYAAKLRGPDDSAYSSLEADICNAAPGSGYGYSCFKNVTSTVRAKGGGAWTVGGIATNNGATNAGGGWTLAVVYESANEPMRNLAVFDGQQQVSGSSTVSIPISGFRTPATGQVKTEIGLVTYEGDRGAKGDYAQLNDTVLSDAKHLSDNFFNSWIALKGLAPAGQNPNYGNQLGFDSAIIAANGILKNNDTSADIRLKTVSDVYEPIVATFATELYAPRMLIDKSVVDLNGGEVRVGDELEYTIDLQNDGADGAVSTVLSEPAMPQGTEFVGGSLLVNAAAAPAGTADTPADHGTGPLTLRLGTGADATSGGLVAPGGSYVVKFRVRVTSPLPPEGGKISNRARLNYAAQTLGSPVEVDSPVAEVTVHRPDAAITKTVGSGGIVDGQIGQYTLTVKNEGHAATDGTTTVTDTIPAEITSPSVTSATGWSCGIVTQVLTCTSSSAVNPSSSFSPIVVQGMVANAFAPPHVITNTATVSTPLDDNPVNDSSTVSTSNSGFSTMTVAISSDKASVLPGDPVKLTGSYGNTGPSAALYPTLTLATTDITNADVSVPVYSVTSSDGSVTDDDCTITIPGGLPTVTCTPSLLAKGVTVEIVITLVPKLGTALTSFSAEATSAAGNDSGGTHSATTSVDIEPTADLAVTKTASVPSVNRGDTVDFTMVVTNKGPRTSGPVTVIDALPDGLTPEIATWNADSSGSGSCTIKTITRLVSCSGLPTLDPEGSSGAGNQVITVTITARAANDVRGPRENTAQVYSTVWDPEAGNNAASASVTILPFANLNITKFGPVNLAPGAVGTYTVSVTNLGPSAAPNTIVTDKLDPQMTAVAPLPSGCSLSAGSIWCFPGNLPVGESRTLTFNVKISKSATPGSTLVNEATASSDVPDPDPASATDEVKVVVGVGASAKISTSITTPRGALKVGATGTISVSVKTTSGGPARNTVVCATIPSNVTYVGSSGRRSGSRVCWTLSSLARGVRKSWAIRVRARRPGTLNATVSAVATNASKVTARSPVRVASAFTG